GLVAVYARSIDKTPSGCPAGGTEQDIGDHVVNIEGIDALGEFWHVLLTWIDALQRTNFKRHL
ncbi:MAG: hypothetical protein GWN58_36965, partial [Anaerolineae bacterium]|nr:hypothetical protein [Anaerolineae bacterium]